VVVHAEPHHRDADVTDVFPDEVRMQLFRIVVHKVTSGPDGGYITGIRLRVDPYDKVYGFPASHVSLFVHPDFIPGWEALYIRRKDILGRNGYTHSKDRPGKQLVCTGRSRTVHIGKADDHVVHPARMYHIILVVLVTLYKNFFISHADVGQRSAQRPQCRHTSSSFTMTRVVGSSVETYRSCDRLLAGAINRDLRSSSSPSVVKVIDEVGQISMHASHSMQRFGVKTVCTSQFRQRCASRKAVSRSKPSSTSARRSFRVTSRLACGTLYRSSSATTLSYIHSWMPIFCW